MARRRLGGTIQLEHGKPLIFGKDQTKGIRLNGTTPEVVELGSVSADDLLVHDETREDPTIAYILAQMMHPEHPVPLGVLRAVERPAYEELLERQIDQAIVRSGPGDLAALYAEGDTWTVE